MIVINARTQRAARLAIANNSAVAAVAVPGSAEAVTVAARLIDDIKRAHRPITRYFHSDAGAKLMRVDSDIAEKVMSEMFDAGTVVLPVHDSFLVGKSKVDFLRNSMASAAEKMGLKRLEIASK